MKFKKIKSNIKIALSLGYPNSYFYNKRWNMLIWWLHLSFFGLYMLLFVNANVIHQV